MSREADVRAVVADAMTRFGRVDCIFNNAGAASVGGSIESIPVAGFAGGYAT